MNYIHINIDIEHLSYEITTNKTRFNVCHMCTKTTKTITLSGSVITYYCIHFAYIPPISESKKQMVKIFVILLVVLGGRKDQLGEQQQVLEGSFVNILYSTSRILSSAARDFQPFVSFIRKRTLLIFEVLISF